MTRDEALALIATRFWEEMDDVARFRFQINEERLCMPFEVFHKAAEVALGRSVWTHEFADPSRLWKEYAGDTPRPTFKEILALIPAEKLIVITENGMLREEKE